MKRFWFGTTAAMLTVGLSLALVSQPADACSYAGCDEQERATPLGSATLEQLEGSDPAPAVLETDAFLITDGDGRAVALQFGDGQPSSLSRLEAP